MPCPRCNGLVKNVVGEYSRCFMCGWHNWNTPMPERPKRKNTMRVRYAKSGKVKDFKDKILRVTVLQGSETRSRSNPTLIGSCPYKCDFDIVTVGYHDSTGYNMRCSRDHHVNVKLSLEQPIWR